MDSVVHITAPAPQRSFQDSADLTLGPHLEHFHQSTANHTSSYVHFPAVRLAAHHGFHFTALFGEQRVLSRPDLHQGRGVARVCLSLFSKDRRNLGYFLNFK